jgi:atypical dual specificity phosphatase
MALPPNFSFIWENLLAGSGHPGNGERLAATLATLREQGITSILSLSEEPLDRALLREFEFDALHVPVEDFTAPQPEQVESAMQFLNARVNAGQGALVHCRAGIGRTGTMLACFLVSRGWPPEESIDYVRLNRPGSLEVYAQEEIVHEYARRLRGKASQPPESE